MPNPFWQLRKEKALVSGWKSTRHHRHLPSRTVSLILSWLQILSIWLCLNFLQEEMNASLHQCYLKHSKKRNCFFLQFQKCLGFLKNWKELTLSWFLFDRLSTLWFLRRLLFSFSLIFFITFSQLILKM